MQVKKSVLIVIVAVQLVKNNNQMTVLAVTVIIFLKRIAVAAVQIVQVSVV